MGTNWYKIGTRLLPGEASEEVGAQGAALHEGDRLAAVAVAGADAQQTVGGADEVVDWELNAIDMCPETELPLELAISESKGRGNRDEAVAATETCHQPSTASLLLLVLKRQCKRAYSMARSRRELSHEGSACSWLAVAGVRPGTELSVPFRDKIAVAKVSSNIWTYLRCWLAN